MHCFLWRMSLNQVKRIHFLCCINSAWADALSKGDGMYSGNRLLRSIVAMAEESRFRGMRRTGLLRKRPGSRSVSSVLVALLALFSAQVALRAKASRDMLIDQTKFATDLFVIRQDRVGQGVSASLDNDSAQQQVIHLSSSGMRPNLLTLLVVLAASFAFSVCLFCKQ